MLFVCVLAVQCLFYTMDVTLHISKHQLCCVERLEFVIEH